MEVDIHHVHGVLGDPDWLLPGPDRNPFGCANRVALETAVRRAVIRINIVDEDIPKSVVEDLLVPLTNADFVYFLGFGFEERNILRLNLPDCLKNTAVVRATCLGKTTLEMTSARGRLKGPHLYHDDDARTFLRERAESLFDD